MISRNRTPSEYVGYGLYLYFSGLSLRKATERLPIFIKRNYVSIWNWIQKYKPQKIKSKKRKISEYIIDETLIKVGSEFIWLWVAIEPKNKAILAPKYQKSETCLLLQNDFYPVLSNLMESIKFPQMVEYSIHKHARFWN